MKQLLIVEDSCLIRQRLVSILSDRYRVYATHDPHQALKLLDQHQIDWLLLNPLLAGNSGLELLYEINTWPDLQRLKTVLLVIDQTCLESYQATWEVVNVQQIIPLASLNSKQLLHFLS